MFLLMKRAGIALGSNLGDKNSLMVQARDHLLQMSLSDDPFCNPLCMPPVLKGVRMVRMII